MRVRISNVHCSVFVCWLLTQDEQDNFYTCNCTVFTAAVEKPLLFELVHKTIVILSSVLGLSIGISTLGHLVKVPLFGALHTLNFIWRGAGVQLDGSKTLSGFHVTITDFSRNN